MIAGIIQARTSSLRLPNKILLKSNGKTILEHQLERISRSKLLEKIIVATTTNPSDDEIVNICKQNKIDFFRGSEEDVLERYFQSASKINASVVVRLTSDNPLLDPNEIDKIIKFFLDHNFDYVSNYAPLPRTCPDGMAIEIFSFSALKKSFSEAVKSSDREHVTFYMWKNPEKFKTFRIDYPTDYSKYRFTLDYSEDFEVIDKILTSLYTQNSKFTFDDIISFLDSNPEIREINSKIKPNQGWEKSLEDDKQHDF